MMDLLTLTTQCVNRISVCPIAMMPESGFLVLDPGAFSEAGEVESLQPLVCRPTNWSRDLTGLPAIVDLAQCDARQRDWLVSEVNEEHENRLHVPLLRPAICAYVEASVDAGALATHIAEQMLVLPVERSGQRAMAGALWRFFDPRVFANLCWMLEPYHLAAIVGRCTRWVYPWFNSWFELRATDFPSEPELLKRERLGGFSRVDMDVWERAQRIATLNQTLVRLGVSAELTWDETVAVAARVESALIEAERRLHWKQSEDQMIYAEHVARFGQPFREHPRLVDVWPRLEKRTDVMSCAELIAILTPDDYNALAMHRGPNAA